MADQTPATVTIPRDVIEPIVRQQVVAGIVAALGDPTRLISHVVERALSKKVNREGKVDSYEYSNKYDLIDIVAQKTITRIAQESIVEFVESRRADIKAEVEKAISRKKGAFAKSLVDGMANAFQQSWQFECNITMPKHD